MNFDRKTLTIILVILGLIIMLLFINIFIPLLESAEGGGWNYPFEGLRDFFKRGITVIIAFVALILLFGVGEYVIGKAYDLQQSLHKAAKAFHNAKSSGINKLEKRNIAGARLITPDGEEQYYFSISGDDKDMEDRVAVFAPAGSIFCNSRNSNPELLPVLRLNEHLLFEPFEKHGLHWGQVEKTNNCTERKILRKILTDYHGKEDVLLQSKLHMFTKWEPCLQCFEVLKSKKIALKELLVYYADMGYSMKYLNVVDLTEKQQEEVEKTISLILSDLSDFSTPPSDS
jgi:hypothetical protein